MPSLPDNLELHVAALIAAFIPRYGEPGSRIPSSYYFRWYCVACGEPMRVTGQNWPPTYQTCEVCGDRHGQIATPAPGPREDASGYQENAIRAMEGD